MVTLHLPASRSLKEKRQVVRSLTERLRRQFNVAVAEVEEQDTWQTAVLGLAVVSNEAGHAQRQLDRIVESIEHTRLDAEVVSAGRLGMLAELRYAAGLPFDADEPLYLRSPDVTLSAGPKRVSA